MAEFNFSNVTKTVGLSSGIGKGCEVCHANLDMEDIGASIDHYLQHGWVLLHVGGQTAYANDGKTLWNNTVAVVGRA